MKKNVTISWLIFVFVFSNSTLQSKNYYFSNVSGDDSRSTAQAQNPNTPWQSIDKLNQLISQLMPGDTVFLKKGERFYGAISINRSGTLSSPIVFSSYGEGDRPVVSGFTSISTWTPRGGGIYESNALPVQSFLNMLVIDGENYPMGRFPNVDAPNKGYRTINSSTNTLIVDKNLSFDPNWTGGEVVIRKNRWIIDRARIDNHAGNNLEISGGSSYNLSNGYGYFIQDNIYTLDQFGEWYYDENTKKLSVYFGEQAPGNYHVQAPTVDVLLHARASHLTFENIVFTGANERAVFYDWREHAYTPQENLLMKGCQIAFSGIDAVSVRGYSFLQMEGCKIAHSNNNGIHLAPQSTNASISNCTIINTGIHAGMGKSGDGHYMAIVNNSSGFTAEYNQIFNTGYNGIYLYGGNSILIKNNYIRSFCTVKDDGGGIYTYTGSSNTVFQNRKIIGNIVLNGVGAPEGTNNIYGRPAEGIYLDDNSTNIEVINNTIAHCGSRGIFLHNARNITLSDNVIFDNGIQLALKHDYLGDPIVGNTITDNIFFSKQRSQIAAFFSSIKDDIQQIGTLNNNIYARPLDDDLVIQTELNRSSDRSIRKWFELTDWSSTFDKDQNSLPSPLTLEPFKFKNVIQPNKFTNGNFDFGTRNVSCYAPIGGCKLEWDINNALNGGSAKISGTGPIYFSQRIGKVDNTKKYIVRFSAVASQAGSIEVYLRKNGHPWNNVSEVKALMIGPERKDFEFVLSDIITDDSPSLIFYSGNENLRFWLDNIAFYEADVELSEPNEFIRFEYNPSQKDTSIILDDRYLDLNNEPYDAHLTLSPFESVILFKDTASIRVLPVQLTRFQSRLIDCNIKIEWTARNESNFSHYVVEKSRDGQRFQALSRIPGIQSSGQHTYSIIDKNPKSLNYYRLKMVDLDSSFSYSDVIIQSVDCGGLNSSSWDVYPTLLNGQNKDLLSRIYTQRDSLTITIVDQNGRTVKSLHPPMQKGWNEVRWSMEDLPPGLYFIHNPDALFNKTIRFVVMD